MKQWLYLFFYLFLLAYSPFIQADLVNLTNISLQVTHNTPLKSQLMLQFNRPIAYRSMQLNNPQRMVIDFSNARLAKPLEQSFIPYTSGSLIKKIRSGHPGSGHLRIVLDLQQPVTTRFIQLQTTQMAIDLLASSTELSKKQYHQPAMSSTHPHKHRYVIVIDPGHGGKDPGAKGIRGTLEKTIVLRIAKEIQLILNQNPYFVAQLTRTSDEYIPLRGRLDIARRFNADLFISIHADDFKNYSVRGASVFALSQHGASSEAAHWLAAEENKSEIKYERLGQIDLSDKSRLLRSVLIDLAQTATIQTSLVIGSNIVQDLGRVTDVHHHHVEQAGFMVLKSPDIPSLLIEIGFLSNPDDERQLLNPAHRQLIAHAIVNAIEQHFLKILH